MNYIPYTYHLYCKPIKKHYYGVRYAKNCHPSDLWKSYFSSSKIIHNLIEIYGKDAFFYEIRKKFPGDPQAAVLWEEKVLTRLKVQYKSNWLNQRPSGGNLCLYNRGVEAWNKGLPSKSVGQKFYNNGNIQKMYFPGEEPKGWVSGRLNKPWNLGLDKTDERVDKNTKALNKNRDKQIGWNKGLTKETDERIKKYAEKLSKTNTGTKRTEEAKRKTS